MFYFHFLLLVHHKQVLPPLPSDWFRALCKTYVYMRIEGSAKRPFYVELELVDDDVVFKKGWRSFVSQNQLSSYNWAVFTYTKRDEIIVNVFNVPLMPTTITVGGRTFQFVDLSSTTVSNTDTESSQYIDTDEETEPDDDIDTDDDTGEMNISEDDEPDAPNQGGPPSFEAPVQNNTAVCSFSTICFKSF